MTNGNAPLATGQFGSLMAVARASTVEETRELRAVGAVPTIVAPTFSTDPLDDLVDRVRPMLARAVDQLQVTAALEADGITDRTARVQYGFADVFALAEAVYRRLGPYPVGGVFRRPALVASAVSRFQSPREILHGLLYALPSAVFPAVLAIVGHRSLIVALVLAGGLGWVIAGGASWAAYRLLGQEYPRLAARLLRRSVLLGLVTAGALGGTIVAVTGARPALAVLVVAQMAYQMASTLLMFYRRELWLLVTMAPAVAVGVGYLVSGDRLLYWAVGVGGGGVLASLAVALLQTVLGPRRWKPPEYPGLEPRRYSPGDEPAMGAALGPDVPMLPWITAYSALSAAFLLQAQAPYLMTRPDIALSAVPLILGTGVVEWRARRFGETAMRLPERLRWPRDFVRGVWRRLLSGVVCCVVTVAALAVPVLFGMRQWGLLTPAAVVMCGSYAVLAGAYFLGFVLAERARFGWLCAALAATTALHAGARLVADAASDPVVDTLWYLGAAVLLQVLFAMALAPVVGQVWRYR